LNSRRVIDRSIEEMSRVNLTRGAFYSFLSRSFKAEVNEPFLEDIVETEPIIKSLTDSQGDGELQEGHRLLLEFADQVKRLKKEDKGREALLTDLAVEYASLFLGVGTNPVHLVESVYLGKDHLLFEQPYHDVLAAYRSLGFEKEKNFPEPEDHVSVEFDFMAKLCGWTSQTLDKKDVNNAIAYLNLQKEFLTEHILKWVPELCKKLGSTATANFYKALAHLTLGFVTIDTEIPDHITDMLKNPFSIEK
jgi:TorA maturation chaperone TorD